MRYGDVGVQTCVFAHVTMAQPRPLSRAKTRSCTAKVVKLEVGHVYVSTRELMALARDEANKN